VASKWTWIGLGLGAIVLAGGVWSQMSFVEEPSYVQVDKSGSIEVRDYPPLIVAEATVKGARTIAINNGFRIIADYIFGNNISSEKVAMTAPVTQAPSEKVAMTAPVTQQGGGGSWTVRFIMPAQYTMETLPKPKNEAVILKQIDGQRMAVIRFSGVADEPLLAQKTQELQDWIAQRKLTALSDPTYAFYNPPWTLGPFRRNEVMIVVGK
jgi:hypothetical protein